MAKLLHAVGRDAGVLVVVAEAGKGPVISEAAGEDGVPDIGAAFAQRVAGGHALADPILTALEAWHILRAGFEGVTQSLSGFNDALLMKRKQWQLGVDDPVGFTPYRAFSQKGVAPLVGTPLANPMMDTDFHPIRTGDMELMDLRLVDSFGQIHDIRATDVVTSEDMHNPRQLQAALPPRITQPARLNLRWLDGASERMEWTSHPATSPVCGWVVPNVLEARLMIHAADGAPLGSVDQTGRWRAPPGPSGGVASPGDIANAALRRLVLWICREALRHEGPQPFVGSFVDLCQTALHRIDPEAYDHSGAKSVIMGRPMALVRARVSLEVEGPLAVKQSLEAFGRELQGHERTSDGFETVRFPIRIGAHDQLNDGVVSFWPEDGDGFEITGYRLPGKEELLRNGFDSATARHLAQTFKTSTRMTKDAFEQTLASLEAGALSEAEAQLLRDLSARRDCFAPQNTHTAASDVRVSRADQQGMHLWLPLDSATNPATVSVLMDPRGALHAATGVLPIKQLTIPQADYVSAMNAIGISLLAAPLLSSAGQIEVGLPKEPGWTWQWISKLERGWAQVSGEPEIRLSAFESAFPGGQGALIWGQLHRAKWLQLIDDTPPRARILPTPNAKRDAEAGGLRNGRDASELGDFAPLAEAILRVIEHSAQAIKRPKPEARFAEQQINEGWLVLSPKSDTRYGDLLDPEETS